MVRHPRGSYIVYPLLPLEVTTPSQKYKYIYIGRCHPYARKFAIKAILSSVQLTLRATRPTHYGATRLVQVMSAWSVKTRRTPPRHCRDAKIYGHTTTAVNGTTTPPPPPPLVVEWSYFRVTIKTISYLQRTNILAS